MCVYVCECVETQPNYSLYRNNYEILILSFFLKWSITIIIDCYYSRNSNPFTDSYTQRPAVELVVPPFEKKLALAFNNPLNV